MSPRRWLLGVWVASSCALPVGCAGARSSSDGTANSVQRPLYGLVDIDSSSTTNSGNVMQVMLRRLNAKAAASSESYEDTAALLAAPDRDETVLAVRPLFPGKRAMITVQSSEDERVIVYFFFTSPGANWRVELPRPLPSEVRLELGLNQVERLDVPR